MLCSGNQKLGAAEWEKQGTIAPLLLCDAAQCPMPSLAHLSLAPPSMLFRNRIPLLVLRLLLLLLLLLLPPLHLHLHLQAASHYLVNQLPADRHL